MELNGTHCNRATSVCHLPRYAGCYSLEFRGDNTIKRSASLLLLSSSKATLLHPGSDSAGGLNLRWYAYQQPTKITFTIAKRTRAFLPASKPTISSRRSLLDEMGGELTSLLVAMIIRRRCTSPSASGQSHASEKWCSARAARQFVWLCSQMYVVSNFEVT